MSGSERMHQRRSLIVVAIALTFAVLSLLSLYFVDHGQRNQPLVQTPAAVLQPDTAAAAKEAGATVTPTDPKATIAPVPPGTTSAQPAASN